MVFKCKMCGANLNIAPTMTVGTCTHCGSTMTLPHLDNDKKANLYDRANHLRRSGEFDKALAIYELILNEDTNDAEAYWSLVLCRYGVEYVEDPKTQQRVPTCHRTQPTPIFADEDYKLALAHADGTARAVYESEAKAIDEIQKGILALSAKEKPFDVFLCYKESDDTGSRTPDSVLAQELYFELTELGYKVFFAKITLENKLGSEYEPYIYAALNSAKVMVVIGTKAKHLNAVWVKNEWSRYLALIKAGQEKVLIPAYKDMDPYDLPEEFSHLQAQDMAKLGFMQDLVRGIRKLVAGHEGDPEEKKTTAPAPTPEESAATPKSLLERAYLFLEDGDFAKASEYFERVLDADPRSSKAYIGKLLIEMGLRQESDLNQYDKAPIDAAGNYQKALRFSDEGYKVQLELYTETIRNNIEARQRREAEAAAEAERKKAEEATERAYQIAKEKSGECTSESQHTLVAQWFEKLGSYKDAEAMAQKHNHMAQKARAESEEQAALNQAATSAKEAKLKKNKIFLAAIGLVTVVAIILVSVLPSANRYNQAQSYMQAGKYEYAISLLEELNDYKDSTELILESKYQQAKQLLAKGQYPQAARALYSLQDYKDSLALLEPLRPLLLLDAESGSYVTLGSYEQDNDLENGPEPIEWLVLEAKDSSFFLLSKYVLDALPFNEEAGNITWAECTLRYWTNTTFLNAAFLPHEQELIQTTIVTTPDNPEYGTSGGNPTEDKVFLLSIQEAEQYLARGKLYSESRYGLPTAYSDTWNLEKEDGNASWWLRSSGEEGYSTSFISYMYTFGAVSTYGTYPDESPGPGVRPAMWVSTDAEWLQTLAQTGELPPDIT